MGGNMVMRLLNDEHQIIAFDPNKTVLEQAAHKGALPTEHLHELVSCPISFASHNGYSIYL
jgi:6-phosphogluconate dehydrogenase (decarboxylating)